MAFDYDGKDMTDSANKKIDLDQYGVWVKKPPRNVEETSKNQSNDTQDAIVQEENFDDILPEIGEIELETSPIDDFETIAQEETSGLVSLIDFEEQPIEDFFSDEEKSDETKEFDSSEIPLETFIDADFLEDFSTSLVDEKKEMEDESIQEPTMNFETEKIAQESDINADSTEDNSIYQDEVTLVPDYMEEEDFDPFPEQAAQNEPQIDTELPTDFTEEKLSFMDESIPTIENFTDAEGNPVIKENIYEENEAVEEEISIDDFLNDDEEVSLDEFLSETGEVSLDAFMDTKSTEKNDILDETPMEMNLTFDDDYAIKTATDPVNQVEDSFTVDEIDDFDEMFDNIVDESQPQEVKEEVTEEIITPSEDKTEKINIVYDEVNEFDDFLSEFAEPKSSSKAYELPKEYDLTVTMDEEGSMGSEVTDIDDDNDEENENISLVLDEEKNIKNEESSIDRLQFSDYTNRSYGSDDFDIDKIMSEVEDIGEKTEEIQENVSQESPETLTNSQESTDSSMEMLEEVMEFNQNEPSEVSRTEELINSIAGEIALLRNEISNLKNEFELFKVGKTSQDENSELKLESQEEKSSGGFFADNNDDDTIALSGDELSNIFNTADFTEESVDVDTLQTDEDSENGLPSMDFDSENLEEPVIEDNYFEEDTDDFPEEIDVPTGIVAQEEQLFEEIELDEEDQGTEEVFEDTDTTEVDFPEDNYEIENQVVEPFEEITEESISDDFVEPAFDSSEDILEEEVVESVQEEEGELEEIIEPEPTQEDVAEVEETELEEVVEEFVEPEPTQEDITEVEETELEEVVEEFVEPEPTQEDVTEVEETELEEVVEEFVEPIQEEITETVESEEEISDEPVESVFESSQWEAPVIDETMGFSDSATEETSEGGVFADDPLIIEEPVDTITSAEEELLEELAVTPVIDDELPMEPEALEEEPVEEVAVVEEAVVEAVADEETVQGVIEEKSKTNDIPDDLKQDIKSVLSYMDQLLDSLPEDKIAEFARSEHFELYKKLFTELGL